MFNKLKRVISSRKIQTFIVMGGLLIVAAALFSFITAHQNGISKPITSINKVLGDCTGSGPGLVLIWGGGSKEQTDITNDCWLHDGQIVFNWSTVANANGSFNWTDTDGNSLSSELLFYHNQGKQATIQLNSDSMPNWLVNAASSGNPGGTGEVASCGTYGLKYSAGNPLIPAYWNPASTNATNALNSTYATALQNALTSLADAINGSAYKSSVLSIRTAFDLIGTEHYSEDDSQVTLYNSQASGSAPVGCGGYTNTLANEAAAEVQDMYYNTFINIGIHPMMRPEVISNSGPGQYFNSTFFPGGEDSYLSPSKAWVFQTSADPDTGGNTNSIWVNYVKTGITIAYAEQLLAAGGQNGKTVNDALSWEWWRELMDLSRGTSYIATYEVDVDSNPGSSFFGQTFFQNFANSYAGHNTDTTESSSPGAWIAFAPNSSPFGGNLGLFMTESSQTDTTCTTYCDSNLGKNILGPGQPYGRYATEINPGGSIHLALDSKVQTGGASNLNVWYYDSGSGDWSISGGSVNQTVTKSSCSSDCWKMVSFDSSSIPSTITLSVPANASSSTYFHMVEMLKEGSSPPPTCSSNPTVSMTAPVSGATVSGSTVALSATASAASHCTLSNVTFLVGSTSIATVNVAPYSAIWDSTTVNNGSFTITATATDTSGHSASSDVVVTVNNSSSTSPGGPGPGSGSVPITVGNGGTVTITPNTTTQVNGMVTLTPPSTLINPQTGSPEYVVKTVYYLDGKYLATVTKPPYSYHLNTTNYLNGTYTLTVRTYYSSGAITISSQELVINNPFSFKELGLLFMHYAIPIAVIAIIILGVVGFLFWWVKFHSPGGKIAIILSNTKTTLFGVAGSTKRLFTNFPPWNHQSGNPSSSNDIGQGPDNSQTPSSSNQIDKIPNPTIPTPGEVVGPENPLDNNKYT